MKYTVPVDLLKILSRQELDRIFLICEEHLEINLPVDIYLDDYMTGNVGEMEISNNRIEIFMTPFMKPKEEFIRTIFHEMAHARQHIIGILTYDEKWMWENKYHIEKKYANDHRHFDYVYETYNDAPWEIDANGWEDRLYEIFVVYNK